MADSDALAYVTRAADLVGLALPVERLAAVAVVFEQMQRFAGPALACVVPDDIGPDVAFAP